MANKGGKLRRVFGVDIGTVHYSPCLAECDMNLVKLPSGIDILITKPLTWHLIDLTRNQETNVFSLEEREPVEIRRPTPIQSSPLSAVANLMPAEMENSEKCENKTILRQRLAEMLSPKNMPLLYESYIVAGTVKELPTVVIENQPNLQMMHELAIETIQVIMAFDIVINPGMRRAFVHRAKKAGMRNDGSHGDHDERKRKSIECTLNDFIDFGECTQSAYDFFLELYTGGSKVDDLADSLRICMAMFYEMAKFHSDYDPFARIPKFTGTDFQGATKAKSNIKLSHGPKSTTPRKRKYTPRKPREPKSTATASAKAMEKKPKKETVSTRPFNRWMKTSKNS